MSMMPRSRKNTALKVLRNKAPSAVGVAVVIALVIVLWHIVPLLLVLAFLAIFIPWIVVAGAYALDLKQGRRGKRSRGRAYQSRVGEVYGKTYRVARALATNNDRNR